MSKRQFITLRTRSSNEEVDVELPGDQMIGELMPDLLKVLSWPLTSGHSTLPYHLETESGERLDSGQTFNEAGVENFDVLWILLDKTQPQNAGEPNDPGERFPGQGMQAQGEGQSGRLPPPLWSRIPIEEPCLVSASGVIFVLGQPPLIIGRRSRDTPPQIDLSELDTQFISSRRHAEILTVKGRSVLRALNTKNGMLVNGVKLEPGQHHTLNDGDTLQFGFRGVQLVFRTPGK